MNPIRLAIVGCTGRMGQTLVRVAAEDPTFTLTAAVTVSGDPHLDRDAGDVAGLAPLGVAISTEIASPCDAVIEFTTPAGNEAWVKWCVAHGVPLVGGTTGLEAAQHAALRSAAERIPIVWAPNMSLGVNLMLEVVANLAAKLGTTWDVEICETHHRRKVDAPSGTANALLEAVCKARGQTPSEVAVHGRAGPCGPRPPGQIGLHALRMGAIVGEHEVHFTTDAESLTVRHRALSRDSFALGALRAARWLQQRRPGLYGMRNVLFM